MKCFVSVQQPCQSVIATRAAEQCQVILPCLNVPCVTKLPKLRPTMQCQVGPLRSSNYIAPVSRVVAQGCGQQAGELRLKGAHCALDVLSNVLFTLSAGTLSATLARSGVYDLLDGELGHGLLGCPVSSASRGGWFIMEPGRRTNFDRLLLHVLRLVRVSHRATSVSGRGASPCRQT